jgi:predicted transcriptional regulator
MSRQHATPGPQPEWGGRLQCLECRHWYANLSGHVSLGHNISPDEYRTRHGLAPAFPLRSAALRDAGPARAARDPDSALQRGAARLAQARRERHERRARELGYGTMRDLMRQHRSVPVRAIAELLGVPAGTAAHLRAQFGRPEPLTRPSGGGRLADPGIQPEEDGCLLCLECGRWFRHVGLHAVNAHEIDVDEYRRRHELPATLALCARDLRELLADKARDQYATTPRIRDGFAANRASIAEHPPPHQHTGDRAGVRAIRRAAAHAVAGRIGQLNAERAQAAYDDKARALGYADIGELLEKSRTLYAHEVGSLLGVGPNTITKLRRRFGLPTRMKRRPGDHHRRPERAVPVDLPPGLAAELAAIPPGVQPRSEDGRLRCLDCGQWHRGLGQHVVLKHGLDVDDYRRSHGLPTGADQPAPRLRDTAEGRATIAAQRRAVAQVAARRKQVAADRRYEQRARELGHATLAEMLLATADLTVGGLAALLGVTPTPAHKLRVRHGVPSPGRNARNFAYRPRQLRPERAPPARRPVVPPGIQPEENGRLMCLECGRWFRGLGIHVRTKHGIGADEYRREHELPAGRGLAAGDLSEAMAERARHEFAANEAIQAAFTNDSHTLGERLKRAREALAESSTRAGVQAAWRASQLANAETVRLRNARARDARAAELGHPSMIALLEATTDLTAAQLAKLLGYTEPVAKKLRAKHGIRSTARSAAAARRRR